MLFYFNPNVWGTVSDWIMIVVTAITAYYLYKTLKSQKEVQKIQQELFEIESIRFKESIKPILKYTLRKGTTSKENQSFFTISILNDSNGIALEIVITNSETENVKRSHNYGPLKTHLKKGDEPISLHFNTFDNRSFKDKKVLMEVEYEDITGTKYRQSVECNFSPLFPQLNPALPVEEKNEC